MYIYIYIYIYISSKGKGSLEVLEVLQALGIRDFRRT